MNERKISNTDEALYDSQHTTNPRSQQSSDFSFLFDQKRLTCYSWSAIVCTDQHVFDKDTSREDCIFQRHGSVLVGRSGNDMPKPVCEAFRSILKVPVIRHGVQAVDSAHLICDIVRFLLILIPLVCDMIIQGGNMILMCTRKVETGLLAIWEELLSTLCLFLEKGLPKSNYRTCLSSAGQWQC